MDRDIGSREMSDDDDADTVSVTSTVLSEEQDNYPLEGILAEREGDDGQTEYLVKWEGYPEERNTWEKREMFQEDQTFLEWDAQKMRVTRGLKQPFDLDAFNDRVEKFYAARDKRKRRRYHKRVRLGLPVTPLEEDDEPSEESDDSAEVPPERQPTTKRRRRLKRRASMSPESESTSADSEAMDTELSSEAADPPQRQWSSKEQSALMNGLERANGPRYEAILEMHSLTLKDFTVSDLESQARLLKKGWKDSGRAVPQCLQLVPDKTLTNKAPITRPEKQSGWNEAKRRKPRGTPHDEASDTSADSLMEDLRRESNAKSVQKKFKKSTPEASKNAPKITEKRAEGRKLIGDSASSLSTDLTSTVNKARTQGDVKSAECKAKDHAPSVSKSAPFIRPPKALPPLPSAVATKPGLTRVDPAPVAQMGPPGRGPRRAPPPSIPFASGKKRPVSGPAVLGNWDPQKPHGNSSLAPKKITGTNATTKAWDKHSIRRRAVKRGRTELAPDMSKLQLITLKDGKAVKEPAKSPATQMSPTKTPYQLLQERERQATERGNPSPVEPTAHNASWMDQMDDEVVLDDAPNLQAPVVQTEQPSSKISTPAPQAPQALMKASEEKMPPRRRVSIPLSLYTQRSQAPPGTSGPPAKTSAAPLPNPNMNQLPFLRTNLPSAAHPSQSPQATRPPPSRPIDMMSATAVSFDQQAPQGPLRSTYNQLLREGLDELRSKDESDVYAAIETGPERNKLPSVKWRGLDHPAKKALINSVSGNRSVWFAQICTAADYKARFDQNTADIFGHGFIVPWVHNISAIDNLAGLLRLQVAGALFHATDFTLLAYPVSTEDWAFLDDRLPYIPRSQIQIRFIMRTLIRDIGISRPIPDARKIDLEKKLSKRGPAVLGEPGINTVMRSLYGIEYQRLIQQSRQSSESARFFLLFPKEAKDEHDLVVQFLDANKALEIYSYNEERDDGVWQYFSNVESGVLIAHSSFWQFHLIPGITYMLRRFINVWALSLRKDKKIGIRRHLTRLFPHGCLLLLTDSLILLQPLEAVRILGWFRLKILVEKPAGTWKIVTRPGLRNFCLNCCNERKDDEEGKRFVQIYQELVYMLDPDDLYDWDAEAPRDEAPIHCMGKIAAFNTKVGRRVDYDRDLDHRAIQRNDEVLTEFFAGWASCRIEDYRRFQVISGFDEGAVSGAKDRWADKCTFLEFLTPAAFHSKFKVPEQSTLDGLAAIRHQALMAEYDRRDRELDVRAEREAQEARRQAEIRNREWEALCAQRPGLKEGYERLQEEMAWGAGEEGGAGAGGKGHEGEGPGGTGNGEALGGKRNEKEKWEEEEESKEWDEWSRDSESVVAEAPRKENGQQRDDNGDDLASSPSPSLEDESRSSNSSSD